MRTKPDREKPKNTVQEEGLRMRELGERVERRWMNARDGRGEMRVQCVQKRGQKDVKSARGERIDINW